jgi:putative ABC transport system permease protein
MLADRLRLAVHELDSSLPVAELRTMDWVADRSYATSRFTLALIGLFAALALLLSAMVFMVSSPTRSDSTLEFGLRMALGAKPQDVVRGVVLSGMKLSLWGPSPES